MSRSVVSILILTYNGIETIEDCLHSVLQASYPRERRELIVADNHSEDGTPELVKRRFDGEVSVVEFERNWGFSKGNNRALEKARSDAEYLVCLNQDTVVHRMWLEELVKGLEKNETFAAAYSAMFVSGDPEFERMDLAGFPTRVRYLALTRSYDIRLLSGSFSRVPIESGTIGGASFIIRKRVIDTIGGLFDEDIFWQAEDDELAFRLRRYGFGVLMVPTSIIFHRDIHRATCRHRNPAQLRSLIAKAFVTTRNRYISFHKNLSRTDFLCVSLKILWTSWRKVREFEAGAVARPLYMAGTAALGPVPLLAFMARLPKLKKRQGPPLRLSWLPTSPDPD